MTRSDNAGPFASTAVVEAAIDRQLSDRRYEYHTYGRSDGMSKLDCVMDALDCLERRLDAAEGRKDEWSDEARKAAAEARKNGNGGSGEDKGRDHYEALKKKNQEAFAKVKELQGKGASGEGRKALIAARKEAGEANKAMNQAFEALKK